MSEVIWRPSEKYIERANVTRFMRDHGIETYEELPWATWFVGGKINLAHVTCDVWAERAPDRVAALSETEDGEVRQLTYRELRETADRLANGLASLGIGEGDAVGIFMPMAPEIVAATLAC